MKDMYEMLGLSKQAHLSWQKRQEHLQDKFLLLIPILDQWRRTHPCMSLKKLYNRIQPGFIGRDAFIDFGMANGYEAVRYAKAPRTTFPVCSRTFPNLPVNALIVDIDQLWVSDITYFRVLGKFFYLVFIMDVYSRMIIGHHAGEHLFAQANLKALEMAMAKRNCEDFSQKTIHHSDRGTQYNSLLYTQALEQAGIRISMCNSVYENLHIERVHQTIKGEYLIHRDIRAPADVSRYLDEAVMLYNEQRPHQNLNMMTPLEFERYICNIPLCQRTPLKLFTANTKYRPKEAIFVDPAQLLLPF